MKTYSLFLLAALAALLSQCKPNGSEPEPDTGPPAVTAVGQVIGPRASQPIGPAGGMLLSLDGKLLLTVPAGALSKETTLTVEPVENTAPNGVGRGYRFGPEGTRFAKPATIAYRYEPGELNGASTEALGIAVQQSDRTWVLTRGAKHDAANRTISSQVRHFSWWSFVTQYRMVPEVDTLVVNGKATFEVEYTNYAGGFPEFEKDNEDFLAPLGRIEAVNSTAIKAVTLNGSASGGDAGSFQVVPTAGETHIEYTAPAEQPAKNPVALTVELQHKGRAKFSLISNIFIKPPISFRVEGREFKKVYGVATIINSPLVGTWLQLVIQEQDSPNGRNHNLNVNVKNPTVGGFDYGEFVEVGGLFPTQPHIGYGHRWEEPDGAIKYAGGKVVITNIDRKNKLLEGSVSGTLVYHSQPTKESPRVHDLVRFSATFSVPMSN